MIRPDLAFFGYVRYTVSEDSLPHVISLFLKNHINVKIERGVFLARASLCKKIDSILSGRVEYKKSEILGLFGFLYRNRKRYGAMIAAFIGIFIFLYSSDLVWDVRIEGCREGDEEAILDELFEIGFSVGTRWSEIDRSKIELELLADSKLVSWINVNRRGTVAYVSVAPREGNILEEKKEGYSNLVAGMDGIIEDITVRSGVAVVNIGDTVKAGDVLISGIIPAEMGGGFCYADGTVTARVNESVSVLSPRIVEEKIYEEDKTASFSINFFGKSINIFKSYRNFNKEYDIIEKTKEFCFSDSKKLPFYFTSEIIRPFTLRSVTLTESQMVEGARLNMTRMLGELFSDAPILGIRSEGCFSKDGYTMTSHVTCIRDIGRSLAFSIEDGA